MSKIKQNSITSIIQSNITPLNIEIRRSAGGVKIVMVGAVGISEFTDNTIAIKCHGTKIQLSGEKIKMNVLENKTLEIYGKVKEISFGYGKS
jgi:hypothetical protein